MDAGLAPAIQDAETSSAAKFAMKPQASVLGVVTNHNNSDIKGGGKTSGEIAADYAHLTGNGENKDNSDKPSNDEASV